MTQGASSHSSLRPPAAADPLSAEERAAISEPVSNLTLLEQTREFFRTQVAGRHAEALRAAQCETVLARTQVLFWVAVGGMPTTCLAYVYMFARPKLEAALAMVGLALVGVTALRVAITLGHFRTHYHLTMLLIVGGVFGPLASGVLELTQGSSGDFFFAFFMIFFSFTALYPAESKWILGTSLTVIVSLVLSRLVRPAGERFDGVLVSNLIYLVELTFMGTVMNRVVYRLFFDEKKARLELAEANKGLRELDRAKSSFFANISHEIRTPLTLILTPLTHLLQTQRASIPADQVATLDSMRSNANRLLKIVNSLLDFAKVEAGQAAVVRTSIDIDDLVSYTASLFAGTARERGLALVVRTETGGLAVSSDLDKLEKILVNLLGNAIKFTPTGGAITVRGTRSEASFQLSVADTGIGIAPEHQAAVFQRFTQIDSAHQTHVRGTGIGLALVKEYARLLGGDVVLESAPGEGSTFTLTLPIEAPTTATAAAPTSADRLPVAERVADSELAVADIVQVERVSRESIERAGIGQPRVLIVDDNPALVRLVASILENDYNLFVAYNGQEALDCLARDVVDLVVSDVMMPGVSGLDLCRRIRADERIRHLPVILLTARGGTMQKIEGLDVGADDYIGKPFDPEELKARVRSLFELRRTTRALAEKSAALEAALARLHDEELKVIESEKLRTLGELAAGIFHELHNYLNIIANGALPLSEGLDDLATALSARGVSPADLELDDLRQLGSTIADAADAAKHVTSELKGYAYQDSALKVTDLNAVVTSTARFFGQRSGVTLELSPDALPVEVVSTRLAQVFTNLIKNAIEAAGPEGKVVVQTRREGDRVIASVTDSGPGVPATARGKLFEPFFTTKSKGQGLGLGLSLSRKVVNDFGGELRLDEAHTPGARFVVSLPARRDEPTPATPPAK